LADDTQMHSYSAKDVGRVLQLSPRTVRGLIDGGFVTPARGRKREYRFSFQDMIVLRTARALIEAKVPQRRIRRSLDDLRRHLPDSVPLSGLSICAVGERVVVREGNNRWRVDDGQYLLGLDVTLESGELRVVERQEGPARPASAESNSNEDWFEKALELETSDVKAAAAAYARAANADSQNVAAWTNWGRLLHESGQLDEAERVYRRALEQCGPQPLLMFNLGVLLEDLGRIKPAVEAYQTALGEDPNLADCHYNLARLYEGLGQPQHAIRHLGQYRRLLSE
jgi:tetratricopeptide (TPR) repeat protein